MVQLTSLYDMLHVPEKSKRDHSAGKQLYTKAGSVAELNTWLFVRLPVVLVYAIEFLMRVSPPWHCLNRVTVHITNREARVA